MPADIGIEYWRMEQNTEIGWIDPKFDSEQLGIQNKRRIV